jgi:hypothetical protein
MLLLKCTIGSVISLWEIGRSKILSRKTLKKIYFQHGEWFFIFTLDEANTN